MRKFSKLIYCLVMAALVLSLSGCGGSGGDDQSGTSAGDKLMVITSPVLQQGESYRLYRGNNVEVSTLTSDDYNPTYYVAPIAANNTVTLNLVFTDSISEDKPFAVEHDDGDGNKDIVFYYNPGGNGQTDIETEYGEVFLRRGSTQKLSYSGLSVTGASFMPTAVDIDTSDEVIITLDASNEEADVDGTKITPYNYVWHADQNHADEYYTLGEGTTEFTESAMLENVNKVKGVYINRDIRYMSDTITFTGTAVKDNETEYVAYYADSVTAAAAEKYGTGYEGPYIFATLPQSAGGPGGMGGQPGQRGPVGQDRQAGQFAAPGMNPNNPPSNVRGAVSNSDITAFTTMTHSAEEAYNNPVLHITESGTYRLKGTWNGQIWVEVGEEEDDKVALILDGVTVTCGVAPALVFKEVYECGPEDEDEVVSFDVADNLHSESGTNAGAIVVIADGSTNNFTGANVYRILKAEPKKSASAVNGQDISQQKKRYKMDGAFYSFMSMVIGAENNPGTGTLNITSTTYEGLDAEMHMLIDSGTINVTAEDDGVNVNEDNVSVFTMNGGNLTIIAKNGDGIDSNGYIVINDGKLDITAAQDSNQDDAQAEGPIDSDLGVYISDTARANYTHRAYSGDSTQPGSENAQPESGNTQPESGNTQPESDSTPAVTARTPISITDDTGSVIMSITYPVTGIDTSGHVASSGDVFTLTHTVNSFSGVK